jgi:predicted transcriptional regulator
MPGVVRLSVNLSPEVAQVLREMADKRGITVTEALRQAISTEKFISESIEKGEKILIEGPKGKSVRQLIFR